MWLSKQQCLQQRSQYLNLMSTTMCKIIHKSYHQILRGKRCKSKTQNETGNKSNLHHPDKKIRTKSKLNSISMVTTTTQVEILVVQNEVSLRLNRKSQRKNTMFWFLLDLQVIKQKTQCRTLQGQQQGFRKDNVVSLVLTQNFNPQILLFQSTSSTSVGYLSIIEITQSVK